MAAAYNLDGCSARADPASITAAREMAQPVSPHEDASFFRTLPTHIPTQDATAPARARNISEHNAPSQCLAIAGTCALDNVGGDVETPSTTGAVTRTNSTTVAQHHATTKQWHWASVDTPEAGNTPVALAWGAHANGEQACDNYVPQARRDNNKSDHSPTATALPATHALLIPVDGSAGQRYAPEDCIFEHATPRVNNRGRLAGGTPPAKYDQLNQRWGASPTGIRNAASVAADPAYEEALAAQGACYAQEAARLERASQTMANAASMLVNNSTRQCTTVRSWVRKTVMPHAQAARLLTALMRHLSP
jgi:hypothetical protein